MSVKLAKQVKEYQQQQKLNVLEFGALSVNCSFAKIAGPEPFLLHDLECLFLVHTYNLFWNSRTVLKNTI